LLRNPGIWRGLGVQKQCQLIAVAPDKSPVFGLTHKLYEYPAPVFPVLVRNVISALSEPGDLILDPFMGSGTTLVEALGSQLPGNLRSSGKNHKDHRARSRKSIGLGRSGAQRIRSNRSTALEASWVDGGYQRHLGSKRFWRIRNAIAQRLRLAKTLPCVDEIIARAIILRTAQCRKLVLFARLDRRRQFKNIGENPREIRQARNP
jgi:hypothetical protein